VQAILAGDNSPAPRLDLVDINAAVKAGDQVVSSGDGGLLPPGLPIGTVVKDAGGFRVALLADAARSESVEILNFARPPEEPPATPQLPAEAAGLPPLPPPPPQPAEAIPSSATQAQARMKMPAIVPTTAPQASSPE
jgi:rod shape-determining protein MreC